MQNLAERRLPARLVDKVSAPPLRDSERRLEASFRKSFRPKKQSDHRARSLWESGVVRISFQTVQLTPKYFSPISCLFTKCCTFETRSGSIFVICLRCDRCITRSQAGVMQVQPLNRYLPQLHNSLKTFSSSMCHLEAGYILNQEAAKMR